MSGGVAVMDIVRKRVNSDLIASIIPVPSTYVGKDVEVVIREIPTSSIVDELYGTASNVKMTDEELRNMRLSKHASIH